MASEQSHIQLALRTGAALDHLAAKPEDYSEWIATTAFYKALHVVETVLASAPETPNHGTDHGHRSQILKRTPKYNHIWKNYRPLWTASMIARYLSGGDRNGSYKSFSEYMPPDLVMSRLVGHNLLQVQKSAGGFLSKEACRSLGFPIPKKKAKRTRKK